MAATIKVRRGLKSSLPVLAEGELGYTTDTNETYIGDGSSNYKFISESDVVTSVSDPGSDSTIPSEQAVREALDAIEYTDSDVDAHLTGGTGIDYSTGTISINSTYDTYINDAYDDSVTGFSELEKGSLRITRRNSVDLDVELQSIGIKDCRDTDDFPDSDGTNSYMPAPSADI